MLGKHSNTQLHPQLQIVDLVKKNFIICIFRIRKVSSKHQRLGLVIWGRIAIDEVSQQYLHRLTQRLGIQMLSFSMVSCCFKALNKYSPGQAQVLTSVGNAICQIVQDRGSLGKQYSDRQGKLPSGRVGGHTQRKSRHPLSLPQSPKLLFTLHLLH